MVAIRADAREVPVLKPADVRFGSKADIDPLTLHVRFTPKSGHELSATMQQQIYLNSSTVANGSADHGRKRFNVNCVFCPGWTSTSR